jgi:protein transport protein SEC24
VVGLQLKTRRAGRLVNPSVDSVFTVTDNGAAACRFMRCTTTAPATTRQLQRQSAVPFALLATPFARGEQGDSAVPEVDFDFDFGAGTQSSEAAALSPPRCQHCQAYINPYVTWSDQGKSWLCNLCDGQNTTPEWYVTNDLLLTMNHTANDLMMLME